LGWAIARGLTRLGAPARDDTTSDVAAVEPAIVRHITATLFYGAADGQALVPVQREIAFAEGLVPQGREIVTAQLESAPAPYLTVIPRGTTLRAFYVTERRDAFVDLSGQIASAHPGGSSAERLTVYAVVNALTANLPTIRRVQLLVNGQEVDTLAGHIDLRNPLEADTSIVRRP
jgi:spore germination protein GerM